MTLFFVGVFVLAAILTSRLTEHSFVYILEHIFAFQQDKMAGNKKGYRI
ncbi:hypothetical protein GCM10017717_20630 [Deinococcus persicinus]